MSLYELEPGDIADLLALIGGQGLTITANNAARVATLQALLANAKPSDALAKVGEQLAQTMRARDAAQLEHGLALKRVHELEVQLATCAECKHALSKHDASGCNDEACTCMRTHTL